MMDQCHIAAGYVKHSQRLNPIKITHFKQNEEYMHKNIYQLTEKLKYFSGNSYKNGYQISNSSSIIGILRNQHAIHAQN